VQHHPGAAVDVDDKDPSGAPVALANAGEILRVAFATDQGQTTRMNETTDNGYFLLHVDNVQASVVKPLADVKERAKELFLADKRNAAAEARAKEIAAAVTQDKSLASVAADNQLTVTTTPAVTRPAARSRRVGSVTRRSGLPSALKSPAVALRSRTLSSPPLSPRSNTTR